MQQQINTIYTISVILLILALVFLALFIFLFLHFFIFKKKKNKNVQEHFDIFEEERRKRAKEKEDRYRNAAPALRAYDAAVPQKNDMMQAETVPLKNTQALFAAGTVPLKGHEEPMQSFYGSNRKDIPLDETLPMEEEEEFEGEDFWAENTVMLDTLDEQETQMLAGNKKEEGFEIKEDIVITHGRKH